MNPPIPAACTLWKICEDTRTCLDPDDLGTPAERAQSLAVQKILEARHTRHYLVERTRILGIDPYLDMNTADLPPVIQAAVAPFKDDPVIWPLAAPLVPFWSL